MVSTPSTMLDIGTELPEFTLPDFNGQPHSTSDYKNEPLLVMFICNHCPYVKHIVDRLSEKVKDYQSKGVNAVAISANDVNNYPQDSPERMKEFAEAHNFSFPYLYDETQDVAKAFKAACTPDFFLFDDGHRLVYRGQFDSSRPKNDEPVTGEDLTEAVNALLEGREIPEEQTPSVGCNIKWIPGNEPDYFS